MIIIAVGMLLLVGMILNPAFRGANWRRYIGRRIVWLLLGLLLSDRAFRG
jgi:hypothetical protein